MTAEIGIVCGLETEAAALGRWRRDPRIAVAISGARSDVALLKARLLAADGTRLLVSWGMAGGLAPALRPGAVVFGSEVHDGTRSTLSPPAGRRGRPLCSRPGLVATPGEKARLLADTGADAVDMETGAVARAAAEAGIPAIAIRAIADPASRAVPAFFGGVVGPEGRLRPGRLALGLARNPAAIPALWRLRHDARAALAALRQLADRDLGRMIGIED